MAISQPFFRDNSFSAIHRSNTSNMSPTSTQATQATRAPVEDEGRAAFEARWRGDRRLLRRLVYAGYGENVLPLKYRRQIQVAVESCPLPGREERRTRQLWRDVVQLAAERRRSLGYIDVPAGGIPALAETLGCHGRTFGRNLLAWEAHGLLRLTRGTKRTRHAPVVGIEIPLLNQALMSLAEMMSNYYGGDEPFERVFPSTAMSLVLTCLDRRPEPWLPPIASTSAEARQWIEKAQRPSAPLRAARKEREK